eukprot:628419-Heterocapsa_arctica.AAC.1
MDSVEGRAPSTLNEEREGRAEAHDQPNPGDHFDGTLGYEGEGPPDSPAGSSEPTNGGCLPTL